MALGGFIKLIQSISKASKIKAYQQEQEKKTAAIKNAAAQQRKALKDAEVTDAGDASQVKDAAKIDEEEKEALLRHKKETEQGVSERKKKGNIVSTFIATIVEFAEGLPIAITLVQLVALFLALIIIVVIIINFIMALMTLTIDTSTDVLLEDTAFHFENAYETSFKDYIDSKGIKHKSITVTVPSDDPDDPDGPKVVVMDNIDFWLQLSDKDIEQYLVNDIEDANKKVQATNFFRFIRMTYRVCYTKDENGEYYLQGIDPEFLLGLAAFEKGYSWMQLYSEGNVAMEKHAWATLNATNSNWVLHELPEDRNAVTESMLKYANVDTAISGAFIINPIAGTGQVYNFSDGPYSFSAAREYYNRGGYGTDSDNLTWFCDLFAQLAPVNKYGEYVKAILSYPEYSELATLVDFTTLKLDDDQHYLIGSLLFSTILTAIHYCEDWYDGTDNNRFTRRILDLVAIERTNYDGTNVKFLGFNSADDFNYRNALEYYLCKLLGKSSISDEELFKYTRALAACTYYAYHHLPAYANANTNNYAALHAIPIGEEVDTSTMITTLERYKGVQPLSTVFYTAQGLLATLVLAQADGDITNYTVAELEDDLDNTAIPIPTIYGDHMCVGKSGLSGSFFDGRIGKSWYDGLETLYEAFDAEKWSGYACVRWDLRTTNGETEKLTTSIMGAAVKRYADVKFDNGKTLAELLTPLNIEANNVNTDFNNNRAEIVEGVLAPLLGGLITNRWFNICSNRMVTIITKPKVETGELLDGAWLFPTSQTYAVSELANLSEGETKTITECALQQAMFVTLDYDPQTDGIQTSTGETGYMSQGSGYYVDGGEHKSFDFMITADGTDMEIGGANYLSLEYYFEYVSYSKGFEGKANNESYNKSMYTTEGYAKYLEALKNYEYNGHNILNDRVSNRAIADGRIMGITYNVFGSNNATPQGNCVSIQYFIPYAAAESGYKIIEVDVCHLSSDTGLYWMDYLNTQYGITPEQFMEHSTVKKTVTYSNAGYNKVPTSMRNKKSKSYFVDLSQYEIYVPRGTHLGYISATGAASGPHYHGSIEGTAGSGTDDKGVTCDNGLTYAQLFGLTDDTIRKENEGISYYPFHRDWFTYYGSEVSEGWKGLGISCTLQYFVDMGWITPYWSTG